MATGADCKGTYRYNDNLYGFGELLLETVRPLWTEEILHWRLIYVYTDTGI